MKIARVAKFEKERKNTNKRFRKKGKVNGNIEEE